MDVDSPLMREKRVEHLMLIGRKSQYVCEASLFWWEKVEWLKFYTIYDVFMSSI